MEVRFRLREEALPQFGPYGAGAYRVDADLVRGQVPGEHSGQGFEPKSVASRSPIGRLVTGGVGARTRLLCGAYKLDVDHRHPLLREPPEVIHLPARPGRHPELWETVDRLCAEMNAPRPGSEAVVRSLMDLLLVLGFQAPLRHAAGSLPARGADLITPDDGPDARPGRRAMPDRASIGPDHGYDSVTSSAPAIACGSPGDRLGITAEIAHEGIPPPGTSNAPLPVGLNPVARPPATGLRSESYP
nr:cupin domain-containing protein [Streptomyces sp. CBMA370]